MKDWHCYIDNQTCGPYPENLLKEMIDRGQLTVDTYVYNDSPEEAPKGWQRAGDTEISTLLSNNSSNGPALPPFQQTQTNFQHTDQNNQKTRSFVDFSKKQIVGLAGSIVLIIGVFCPIASAPIIGNLNYLKNDGIIFILVFAVISIIVTLIKKYEWLWSTGLGSLGVIILTFFNFVMRMSEMKSKMKSELAGNPFIGLAGVAVQSVQLQWGWIMLLFGAMLVVTVAVLNEIVVYGELCTLQSHQKTRYYLRFYIKRIAKLVGFSVVLITVVIVPIFFRAAGIAADSANAAIIRHDLRGIKSAALLYYGDNLEWPTQANVHELDKYGGFFSGRYEWVKIGPEYKDGFGGKRANIGVKLRPKGNGAPGIRKKLADKAEENGLLEREDSLDAYYSGSSLEVYMNMR